MREGRPRRLPGSRGRTLAAVAALTWLATPTRPGLGGDPAEPAPKSAKAPPSAPAPAVAATPSGRPADDRTFRPTVIVRDGNSQGSGTIIASVEGETLVLTAAHVVHDKKPVRVELHRYNLGVEHDLPSHGWPIKLPAEVAAVDEAGDVAVVRVRGRPALPFVGTLGGGAGGMARDAVVTSVGVDGGDNLQSWPTRILGPVSLVMSPAPAGGGGGREAPPRSVGHRDPNGRPFLVTARAPEHGRSGGGLFTDGGRLVGVCVGRLERGDEAALGLFAASEGVQKLLKAKGLDASVARSEAARARPKVAKRPP